MRSTKLTKRAVVVLLLAGVGAMGSVHAATTDELAISGVNDVSFGPDNKIDHLGNGFVVQYQGRYFGVTAKHVLLMTKNTGAKGTELPAQTQWVLRNKAAPALTQTFGKALNGSANEALDMKVLETDTLVFALDSAPQGFAVLQLASKEVVVGDALTAVGCSYNAPADCRGEQHRGKVVELKAPHLMVDLGKTDLRGLYGMSGAPVLNAAGELVGIVSQFLPDSKGVERSAYFDLKYLRQVLQQAIAVTQS